MAPESPRTASGSAPCGEIFDMHGPEQVMVHVPHITQESAHRFA